MQPTLVQRVENAGVAVAILVGLVVTDSGWWWPLVWFLAFDLSALGYLANTRIGATIYNLVHNYAGPAVLTIVGLLTGAGGIDAGWTLFVAALWGFHVAADRALGFGLKHADHFGHTHLGMIGSARRVRPAGGAGA